MDNHDEAAIAILRAIVGRIIPPDQDPGALELGTDRYVMAQLSRDAGGAAAAIWQGLAQLDALARERFGRGFVQLATDEQDGLIALNQQTDWFVALAELTAEGFYADPANGGNRDALSWRMIGYEHRLPDGPNGPMPSTRTEARDEP